MEQERSRKGKEIAILRVLAPIAIMCVAGCAENPQVPQNGDEVARNAPSPTAQQTETCAPETEFERQGPVDYD